MIASLRSVLKGITEAVCAQLPPRLDGFDRLILAYHNVVEDDSPSIGDRSLHLRQSDFQWQIETIGQLATLSPLDRVLSSEPSDEPLVAITFDDAYSSALALGVDHLARRGIPSTVFVSPGLLGSVPIWDDLGQKGLWDDARRSRFLWDELGDQSTMRRVEPTGQSETFEERLRIASECELLRLVGSELVLLGNHTYSHVNCAAVSAERFEQETRDCASWLRARFKTQYIDALAYPYGLSPQRLRTANQNLAQGLLVSGGWYRASEFGSHRDLPRWNIAAGISRRGFAARARRRWPERA